MTQALKLLNLFLISLVPLGFLNFSNSPFAGGKFIILQALMGIGLFTVALMQIKANKITIYESFNSKPFLIGCLTFGILSLFTYFSLTPQISLHGTLDRYMGLYTFSLLFCIFSLNRLFLAPEQKSEIKQHVFSVFNITTLLIAIYGIAQFFGFDPLFEAFNANIFHGRIFSLSGNPSYLGQLMCISSLYNLQKYNREKNKTHLKFLIPQLAALLLSQTRTSILGFLFGALIIYRKHLKKYILICLAIFLLSLSIGHQKILNSNSLQSRFQIWSSTIELIKERPIGYGIENIQTFFPLKQTSQFNILEDNIYKTADKIHNQTLSVIYSTGPLGLLLYVAIIIFLIKTYKKNPYTNLIILTNIFQHQLSFYDLPTLTISTILISLTQTKAIKPIQISKWNPIFLIILSLFTLNNTRISIESHHHYKQYQVKFNYNYEQAQKHLQQALLLQPHSSKLWLELGYSNLEHRLTTYENLNRIEFPAPQSKIWLAKAISEQNPSLANQIFEDLHKINIQNPIWLLELITHQQKYNHPEYQDNLKKFQDLTPHIWKKTLSPKAQTFIDNFPQFYKFQNL